MILYCSIIKFYLPKFGLFVDLLSPIYSISMVERKYFDGNNIHILIFIDPSAATKFGPLPIKYKEDLKKLIFF